MTVLRVMNDPKQLPLTRRRSRSLAQEVMEDLTAQIRGGTYAPGERLPTEPELMAQQGVSRTVVREAMSRLQAAGLVETRHGVGTFVLPPAQAEAPALDLATVLTIRDVLAMLEVRISVETEAAALAAQRRTDAQLAAMRRAVDAFDESVAAGHNAIDEDFDFHLQIALATQNKYFEEFHRHNGTSTIPRTRVATSELSVEPTRDYLHRVNREHEYILAAITLKDAEGARAAMRMHLTHSRELLRLASEGKADSQDKPGQRGPGESSRG